MEINSTIYSLLIKTHRKGKKEGGTEPQEEQRKRVFKKSHFHSLIYTTLSVSLEDAQPIRAEVTFRTITRLLKKVKASNP